MRGGAITKDLELGGETRTLRFDYNAIAELEGVLGGGFASIAGMQLGARSIRALVWAGLTSQQMYREGSKYRGPAVALHEVGAWLADADGEAVQSVIIDLISAGLPEDEGKEEGAPDPLPGAEVAGTS